jgi:ATP-dependent RNA helicase RhlE
MKFEDLGLSADLLAAVKKEGYVAPTPIQCQAIGHVLARRDLLGVAQTGTGKTAAFALPILQRLDTTGRGKARGAKPRVLVLSPTRELATQIAASFAAYGRQTGVRLAVVYGGVSQQPQVKALRNGVEVVVATPGRLLDLMQQRLIRLDEIDTLVVDEADRMFDMGFIRDIYRIVAALPKKRQTLLFSATMPDDIRQLADKILSDPTCVRVAAKSPAADTVEQSVYFVDKRNKPVLLQHLIEQTEVVRALVFTRTKHGADKLVRHLSRAGIRAEAIHGNKSQGARQRALQNFKSQKPPVLVATDVAARGLDIDEVSHVVNFDLPDVPETYVHRIGRTGRAGAAGIAVSFCGTDERDHLRAIERLLRRAVPVQDDHPDYPKGAPAKAASNGAAKTGRSAGPSDRKPHATGPADGRQRSRRRKFGKGQATTAAHTPVPKTHAVKRPVATRAAATAPKPVAAVRAGYTTMW